MYYEKLVDRSNQVLKVVLILDCEYPQKAPVVPAEAMDTRILPKFRIGRGLHLPLLQIRMVLVETLPRHKRCHSSNLQSESNAVTDKQWWSKICPEVPRQKQ